MRVRVHLGTMPGRRAYLSSDPLTSLDGKPVLVIEGTTFSAERWPTNNPAFAASLDQERNPLIEEWNHAVRDVYRRLHSGRKGDDPTLSLP